MYSSNIIRNTLSHVCRAVCVVCRFYGDGFRSMTVGRVLWTIILIKLFVIFAVLKLFFFPDILGQKAPDGDKASYVAGQLTKPVDQ